MSRPEHGPAMPLEQRCVRPGHWLIEGYNVDRVRLRGHGWWWRIKGQGTEVRTLAEAREWITERIAQ